MKVLVQHPESGDATAPTRVDSGVILKRYHFLEALVVSSCAAWISSVRLIETKALLARLAWEASLTADALRERVFEIRFPSKLMEVGEDAGLVDRFRGSVNAPSTPAFLWSLANHVLPALRDAETQYLMASDRLADGPSRRFLELSVLEKQRGIDDLGGAFAEELACGGGLTAVDRKWLSEIEKSLRESGSVFSPQPAPRWRSAARPYQVPFDPARDPRYFRCNFYWPDTLDPDYDYGSGIRLQLRSAVSHLNEVWAVEIAGAALYELFDELGWEFVRDAARWTYDESRHMLMGQRRLSSWGFTQADIPLGRYIYDATMAGGDPIYLIGMLGFFETKNIGKKRGRARAFGSMGDRLSERDMEFDWADETIHAEYGRRWLKRLLSVRSLSQSDYSDVLNQCGALVAKRVEEAGGSELDEIRLCAERLSAEGERLSLLS